MRALLLLIYHDYGDAKEAVGKEGKAGKGVVVVHHQGTHPIQSPIHPSSISLIPQLTNNPQARFLLLLHRRRHTSRIRCPAQLPRRALRRRFQDALCIGRALSSRAHAYLPRRWCRRSARSISRSLAPRRLSISLFAPIHIREPQCGECDGAAGRERDETCGLHVCGKGGVRL